MTHTKAIPINRNIISLPGIGLKWLLGDVSSLLRGKRKEERRKKEGRKKEEKRTVKQVQVDRRPTKEGPILH